jgi:hypothetical protein
MRRAPAVVLDLPEDEAGRLVDAARDSAPVSGLTHNFYRYPARFSPKFVRAAIEILTAHGDTVLDPFMGGGTSLVEAVALGRRAVGIDISSLATFITEVKTTVHSEEELARIERWGSRVTAAINVHKNAQEFTEFAEAGYYRHLASSQTWRLRKCIEQALRSAEQLDAPRAEAFARCVILRTAQWALDGRKKLPSVSEFRQTLQRFCLEMIDGARALRDATKGNARVTCLNRTAAGVESDPVISRLGSPRLVLTSPPYPGIHVLYHRWQVDGRKETPAPFWIADRRDGSGSSYYTMGDRKARELCTYFDSLRSSLRSVAALIDRDTIVVQVVAFSSPAWQLSRYLSVVDDAGLEEIMLPTIPGSHDGRLWRTVPNRKWHADQKGRTGGSEEVVLFHRKKPK